MRASMHDIPHSSSLLNREFLFSYLNALICLCFIFYIDDKCKIVSLIIYCFLFRIFCRCQQQLVNIPLPPDRLCQWISPGPYKCRLHGKQIRNKTFLIHFSKQISPGPNKCPLLCAKIVGFFYLYPSHFLLFLNRSQLLAFLQRAKITCKLFCKLENKGMWKYSNSGFAQKYFSN